MIGVIAGVIVGVVRIVVVRTIVSIMVGTIYIYTVIRRRTNNPISANLLLVARLGVKKQLCPKSRAAEDRT